MRAYILSDVHYAGPLERLRRGHEAGVIGSAGLRLIARAYRHFIWLRDPFGHNHLLDHFLHAAADADTLIANGDYSCDTAFVGVSDDAACASAAECLARLRAAPCGDVLATIGDHELGKKSLFGNVGGLRRRSWERCLADLRLQPVWHRDIAGLRLIGVTSTLLALPVYAPEVPPEERAGWEALREAHLDAVRFRFASADGRRIVLFCHDPTALPFLWADPAVREHVPRILRTIIGHLHSKWVYRHSRLLAGLPEIRGLGVAIGRMSAALSRANCWSRFKVLLCPSLAGLEITRDGGFIRWDVDPQNPVDSRFQLVPMPRHPPPRTGG